MTRKTATTSLRNFTIISGLAAVLTSPLSAAVLDWSIHRSDYTIANPPYTDPAGRNAGTIWNSGNTQVLTKTLVDVNATGVDVRVTITGNTADFATSANNSLGIAAPQVSHLSWDPAGSGLRDTEKAGGTFPTTPENPLALVLDLDYAGTGAASWARSVTVTFDYFNTGTTTPRTVQNVSFEIYDIDALSTDGGSSYSYVDEVRNVSSVFNGGAGFNATLTPGASTTPPGTGLGTGGVGGGAVFDNNVSNTLYGQLGSGETTKGGHATANYANALLQSMSLTYGNYNVFNGSFIFTDGASPLFGAVASNNPVQQFIGIGNINFTATPEAGTVVGYAAALGLAGLMLRRRRK